MSLLREGVELEVCKMLVNENMTWMSELPTAFHDFWCEGGLNREREKRFD